MDWLQKIRPRHLELLVSLEKSRNLTRTAAELGMHQSGVSKMLRELEEDIGLRLFDRRSRGVTLNEAGRVAYGHASRIKAAMESFRDEMTLLSQQGGALVSLGFSGASSIDALPSAVLALLQRFPSTHVRITEGAAPLMREKLLGFEIDLLVAQSGLTFDPAQGIGENILRADKICLAVRTGHPLSRQTHVSWQEVADYPMVLWAQGTPIRQAFDKALSAHGWTQPKSYLESNSASINMNLLLNSDMVGISTMRGAQGYAAMGVLHIVPIDLGTSGTMSVYWRREDDARRQIASFIQGLGHLSLDG